MPLITADASQLWLIDFQTRLIPAIHEGAAVVENARRLAEAARVLSIPTNRTEQYPRGLGSTVPDLAAYGGVVEKLTFGSCATPAFMTALPAEKPDKQLIVAGCEAHVCVCQTVLGLVENGFRTFVVADAVGSRTPANKTAALARMAAHGAEIVTTEMVIFEWLGSAAHPQFRTLSQLIR